MKPHPLVRRIELTCIFSAVLVSTQGMAQWTTDTFVNTSTSISLNDRQHLSMVSDGAGGAIVVWEEYVDTTSGINIVAQRLDAMGNRRWGETGVSVCSSVGDQRLPTISADGYGGAIITWYDGRGIDTDIYAQRVNANGLVLWSTDGVPLCLALGNQWDPVIVGDGASGAIVVWYEARYDTAADIYAQRVSSTGVVQWATDGVPLCIELNGQVTPIITADEAGGAIAVWLDFRNGVVELFTQRVNQAGVSLWGVNGLRVSDGSDFQYAPALTSDGTGGVIITWHDFRSGVESDIYAQRINSAGVLQWPATGVVVSNAVDYQYRPRVVSDGVSGAMICWYDYRSGANSDIYAQRLGPLGEPLWTPNGVLICGAINDQQFPGITSDGRGGAFIAWQDTRNGSNPDIFSQHVNPQSGAGFVVNGIAVSTATNGQFFPRLVSNSSGAAILTWEDRRSGTRQDIFAHRTVLNNADAAFGYWIGGTAVDIEATPAYTGLHPDALDGTDGRDITEPPSLPTNYISVTSLSTTAERFIQDVREDTAQLVYTAKRWSMQARTSAAGSSVNLVFTEDRLPPQFTPVLYEIGSGSYRDLRLMPVLSYTASSTPGEPHGLLLLLGDSTKPSVSIVTPNGGESLLSGHPYTIQWNSSDSSGLLRHYLYYTLDSLQQYVLIDSTSGQDTSYVWTPSQASMNALLSIVTVDSALNISADTSDSSFTIVAGDSVAYTTFAGWNMIGVPLLQTDMSPQGIFGDDLVAPINVYGFNPVSGYIVPDTLRLGAGYWLRTPSSQVIDAVGTVQDSVALPLYNGWNMIGNPFPIPFPKSMVRFTDGVTTKTFAEAQSAGWLMDVVYGFNGMMYVQENQSLTTWNGYWLRILMANLSIVYDLNAGRGSNPWLGPLQLNERRTGVGVQWAPERK